MVSYRCLKSVSVLSLFILVIFLHAPLVGSESEKTDAEKTAVVRKLYRSYKAEFPDVADISAAEARTLFEQEKAVFIDARSPEEQAVSNLPGAVTEVTFLKDPGIAQGKTAVAYCTVGYRSGIFAKKMGRQGIKVVNLSGGILAWVLNGGKVYNEGRETNRVHVYGKEWNYLPGGYEAVMFGLFEKLIK